MLLAGIGNRNHTPVFFVGIANVVEIHAGCFTVRVPLKVAAAAAIHAAPPAIIDGNAFEMPVAVVKR